MFFLVRGGKVDMREGEETFANFTDAGSGADRRRRCFLSCVAGPVSSCL